MIYKRHYLQFNDLVFDASEMIDETDASVSFKSTEHDYTFRHGSYAPLKQASMLAESGSVSFTLRLQMKKLPCDVRMFYPQFVVTQLTRPGKLWAVQNNTLVWAHAYLVNYTSIIEDTRRDEIRTDVEFFIPEGIWHKADMLRTFLRPHDKCEFMECYGYKDIRPCRTNCCSCHATPDCNCCFCYEVTKEMALCYFKDLQFFYDRCDTGYHIVYDCEAAERFFGNKNGGEHFGQRFCGGDGLCGQDFPISGVLYSDTEIPADGYKISLVGSVSSPYVEINGNGNIIKGDYDGLLEIYSDGAVYFTEENCLPELLDVSNWQIPSGMTYGWTINPGNNSVKIQTNTSCPVCAFIEIDALTI